jgi:Protein of unknown function (DUF3303)
MKITNYQSDHESAGNAGFSAGRFVVFFRKSVSLSSQRENSVLTVSTLLAFSMFTVFSLLGGCVVKYVVAWTSRSGGSPAENEEAAERALKMYQKWSPPSTLSITEWVARLDGEGGFAVLETDDPAKVIGISARFSPYLTAQVYPVVGMDVAAKAAEEGIGFRKSIG